MWQGSSTRGVYSKDGLKIDLYYKDELVKAFDTFASLALQDLDLPAGQKPFLMCHSMGCGAALMSLFNEVKNKETPRFAAAAMNSPMIQIVTAPLSYDIAMDIFWWATIIGMGTNNAPTKGQTFEEVYPPGDASNCIGTVTSSTESGLRCQMKRVACRAERNVPQVGGSFGLCTNNPDMRTLVQFDKLYNEIKANYKTRKLGLPLLIQQAKRDTFVQLKPQDDLCKLGATDCTLTQYNSLHDIWGNPDTIRTPALAEVEQFFDAHASVGPRTTGP